MKIVDTLKMSLRALIRQKTRSLLTSFAVVIGIFLIVVMVSASIGGEELLRKQFTDAFDLTSVIVGPKGSLDFNFASPTIEEEEIVPLTPEAADKISQIEGVTKTSPIVVLIGKSLSIEGQEKPINNVVGSGWDLSPDDKYIQEILAGRVDNLKNGEAILSNKITDAYEIEPEELIGKKVTLKDDVSSFLSNKTKDTIGEQKFTIVGVIDAGGRDQNNFLVSVEQALELQYTRGNFGSKEEYLEEIGYDQILINARDEESSTAVAEKVKEMGFDASTIEDILALFGTITTIVQIVFSMFGVVALIVASIGIINTMIMSVFERTREIGVMKAVGATKKDIRRLFLTEAAFVGLIGGIIGLLISLVIMAVAENILINRVFPAQDIAIDNIFTTPVWLIVGPILFSTLVGMLAGVYPAIRASKLNPVDALRYE